MQERRIHYGSAARMRILSARTQNSLWIRSENAKFECQNAELTTDPAKPQEPIEAQEAPGSSKRGPGSPWKPQVAPGNAKRLQKNRWSQEAPKDPKRVPGSPRWPQEAPKDPKRVPGSPRKPQVGPGGPSPPRTQTRPRSHRS